MVKTDSESSFKTAENDDFEALKSRMVTLWKDLGAEAVECARNFLNEFIGRKVRADDTLEELLTRVETAGLLSPNALLALERISEMLDCSVAMETIVAFTHHRISDAGMSSLSNEATEHMKPEAREIADLKQVCALSSDRSVHRLTNMNVWSIGKDDGGSQEVLRVAEDCDTGVDLEAILHTAEHPRTPASKRDPVIHHAYKTEAPVGSVRSVLDDFQTSPQHHQNVMKDLVEAEHRYNLVEFLSHRLDSQYIHILALMLQMNARQVVRIQAMAKEDVIATVRHMLVTYLCRTGELDVGEELVKKLEMMGCHQLASEFGTWLRSNKSEAEKLLHLNVNEKTERKEKSGVIRDQKYVNEAKCPRAPFGQASPSMSIEALFVEIPSPSAETSTPGRMTPVLQQEQAHWSEKVLSWNVPVAAAAPRPTTSPSSPCDHQTPLYPAEASPPKHYSARVNYQTVGNGRLAMLSTNAAVRTAPLRMRCLSGDVMCC